MNIFQRFLRNILNRNQNSGNAGTDLTNIPVDNVSSSHSAAHAATAARTDAAKLEQEATKLHQAELDRANGNTDHFTQDIVHPEAGDNKALKDLGGNPVFANAVNDIEANIAKQKINEAGLIAAARADQEAADANSAKAGDLEKRAQTLEQPVNPAGSNKNGLTLPLIISSILVLIIIGAVLLKFVFPTPPVIPSAPQPSGPQAGTTMASPDGSTLVFIPDLAGQDNNGKKGFWITLNKISNYQFSLCVQSGKCKPPTDPNSLKDYGDPTKEGQPVSIVGPDIVGPDKSAGYCGWINGRVPTDAEVALGDGSVHSFGPEYGFNGGVYCIVDAPRPMALYCKTSPYYDPTKPVEKLDHTIEPKGSFCKNGLSYVTLDVALDLHDSIQSVVPQGQGDNCQAVGGNRMLCGGASSSSTSVVAGLVCDSMTGFMCQAGSTMDASGCTDNLHGGPIAGMDDWERGANGVLVPTNGLQFNGGVTMSHPFTPNFVFNNGVMVAQQNIVNSNTVSTPGVAPAAPACPVGTVLNLSCPLALDDPLYISKCCDQSSAANESSEPAIPAPSCPVGYFFDDLTKTCVGVRTAADVTCLGGYHLDPSNMCCSVSIPNGNYPGCPVGQLLDPKTGQCDSQTTLLSPTSLLHTQSFDVKFPDCSLPTKNGSGDSGGSCPAGQSYVCSGIKVITCGCK